MARASMSPSSSSSTSQIRDLIGRAVGQFVGQLSSLIEQDAVSRARETILSAFGSESPGGALAKRGRGRPPGRPAGTVLALASGVARKRRKAPIQLCPVPGCNNRAAPVFGMVCSKHKDLPKLEIRKYREARRARRHKDKDKKKTGKVGRPSRKVGRPPGPARKPARAAKRAFTPPSVGKAAAKPAVASA
jgi:hypothetical protein